MQFLQLSHSLLSQASEIIDPSDPKDAFGPHDEDPSNPFDISD